MSNLSKRLCGSIGIALIWAVVCLNEPNNEMMFASCALLLALFILISLLLVLGYFDK